jgi:hypothetical protein
MRLMRAWIGVVVLTIGVLTLLDATGVLNAGDTIGRWWPLAVIGAGVIGMIPRRRVGAGPAIVVLIGVVLLADQQGWTRSDLLGPAILVLVGIGLLAGIRPRRALTNQANGRESLALFGGTKIKDRSEHLEHADVSSIFGGATLDLREAHIDREASVDATAVFGGVEVLVPRGWRVKLAGVPIFGGYEDRTRSDAPTADAPTLHVNATAIFGGVNVAHEPS